MVLTRMKKRMISRKKFFKKVIGKIFFEELEWHAAERTKEMEKRLQNQKQMVSDISHSLQTPLTVMKGELELLKQDTPLNKKLSVFERSIDEMSAFISDLLTLARLESEARVTKQTPINISDLCEEIVEYLEVIAFSKRIRIIPLLEQDIFVCGIRKKLTECIQNIIGNAITYMKPSGTRTISITLTKEDECAILLIADTGRGIPTNELPCVFERFYRVRESKTKTHGTGLGLPIAKKIIENHGGTISIESVLGKGTTFTITLPLHLKDKKEQSPM